MIKQPGKKLLSTMLLAVLLAGQPLAVIADSAAPPDTSSPQTTQPAASTSTSPPPAATTSSTPAPAAATDAPAASTSTTPPADTTGSQPAQTPSNTGPTTPTGPQTPVGPQTPPGVQGQTGPSKSTGTVPDFAFNQASQHWDPTDQSSFAWSPTLGRYTSPLYRYDTPSGWWFVLPPPPAPVAGSTVSALTSGGAGAPLLTSSISNGDGYNSPAAAILAALLGLGNSSNSNTGPNSVNNALSNSSSNVLLQALGNALIHNIDNSNSTTGNANVIGNTKAGDATSGPANIIENLLNLLNAAWSWSSGGLSYFAQNLFGDHTGDIRLEPTSIGGAGGQLGSNSPTGTLASNANTGPNSVNNATSNANNNLTVVNKPTGAINNDINLLARTGNATVRGNTQAGNATSGDASVELSILNLINSAISSGSSFFGLLNIFGNLNGDILFPDGFLNGIVGAPSTATGGNSTLTNANTGPNSNNNASVNSSNNANITNNPSAAFNNNIQTAAKSGNAAVTGNSSAGSSQSGDSSTKNNLFNLFNTSLMGDNAVLVLVNVMGKWVGHIMTLPDTGGSTGALLTGNAVVENQNTGPNSVNNAQVNSTNNANIINSPTGSITNNIHAGALSGDATVDGNTLAGNAKSGAAKVATNIANIFGSTLKLKKWFGILVINVFGNWNGSVGDNTSAGDPIASPVAQTLASPAVVGGQPRPRSASSGLVSTPSFGSHWTVINNQTVTPNVSTADSGLNAIVAAAHTNPVETAKAAAKTTGLMIVLAAAMMMLAGGALALERRLRS